MRFINNLYCFLVFFLNLEVRLAIKKTMRIIIVIILGLLLYNPVFSQISDIDSLKHEYETVKDLKKQIETGNKITQFYSYQNIDSVRKYGFNTLKKAYQLNNRTLISDCYHSLIYGYGTIQLSSTSDTIWTLIDSAMHLAAELKDENKINNLISIKGTIYFNMNDYENCIRYYLQANELAKKCNDFYLLAKTDNNIANYYFRLNKKDSSLRYYLLAKDIFKAQNATSNLLLILNNISYLYSEKQDTINMIKCFDEYFQESKKTDNPLFIIFGYRMNGRKFAYRNNFDSATFYFNKAIQLGEKSNIQPLAYSDYALIGALFKLNEEWDSAITNYSKALDIVEDQDVFMRLNILKNLSDLNKNQNNYNAALQYLTTYKVLYDSLKIGSMESLLDKALTEQELSNRINEITLLKYKYDNNKIYILLTLTIILVLLFISIWVFTNRLIFDFSKKLLAHNHQDCQFWNFNFQKTGYSYKELIFITLLIVLTNFILFLIFYSPVIKQTWFYGGLCLLALISFLIQKTINRRIPETIYIKSEIRSYLIAFCVLSIFNFAIYYGVTRITGILPNYILLLLIGFNSSLILLSIHSVFIYVKRNIIQQDIAFENLKNLIEKRITERPVATHKIQSDKIVTIDNIQVNINDLLYVVSDNVYQELIMNNNGQTSKHLVRCTLNQVEQSLKPFPEFLRCHRSYIVNTNAIDSIKGNSRQQFFKLKTTSTTIPISRTLNASIMEFYNCLVD